MQALMQLLADRYERAQEAHDRAIVLAWAVLADASVRQASFIRTVIRVSETNETRPYGSADELVHDIDKNHRLVISSANCEHPLWTPRENVAFRVAHDYFGHYKACLARREYGFNWEGECGAAAQHEALLVGIDTRRALMTEVLGQAAYYLTRGVFPPQKAVFL